ncbi:acyl-CoA thioesterase [Shimazuella alba]|uniref:YbgC/FadM family acyl-CoA thioesterase n=1 Tax=Shimazuella alba TaxID=2690964 RepID=A0A6I4VR42_9BACL|nr:thioesterase family protein [Shimazuella alba]MXQ54117.1 YbgC/FadM family acyl-CoA thioesterase [Shimazuella alba]
MVLSTEIRVRYQETDQMGVVYHANYLVWFEVGRTNLIRKLGFSYPILEAKGILLPVVDVGAQYRDSAKYDDVVVVETEIEEIGPSKIVFHYCIKRKADQKLLATGHTKHIWVSREMKRIRLSEKCPELYNQLLKLQSTNTE